MLPTNRRNERDNCFEKDFSDRDESPTNNGNCLERSENRIYKDAKLNEMFINEQKNKKQNNKKSIDHTDCSCKNIKLCDIICHKCQQKLIKYNNGNSSD